MGARPCVCASTCSWKKNPNLDITNVRGDACTHAHQPWTRSLPGWDGGSGRGERRRCGATRAGPGRAGPSERGRLAGAQGRAKQPDTGRDAGQRPFSFSLALSFFFSFPNCNPFQGFCPKEPKWWLSPRSGWGGAVCLTARCTSCPSASPDKAAETGLGYRFIFLIFLS